MTVVDEELLRRALHRAADTVPVPDGAGARIVAAAGGSTGDELDGPAVDPSVGSEAGVDDAPVARHRARRWPAAVAAGLVLAVAGSTGLGLVLAGSSPGRPLVTAASPPHSAGRAVPSALGLPSAGSAARTPLSVAAPGSSGTGSGTGSEVPPLPAGSVGQSAAVVETGSVSLQVGRGAVAADMTGLAELAAGNGGYVSTSQTSAAGGGATGTTTLRVPDGAFPAVVAAVKRLGTVESLSTTATDVTGQVTDLAAQITALEAARQQYLTIMQQATTIGDILSVQDQLNTLESQIQQLQGQQAVLADETTYATLSVSLRAKGAPGPPPAPAGLRRAWDQSVHGFVAGVEWLVRIGGPLLFVALVVAVVAVAARRLWRQWVLRRL